MEKKHIIIIGVLVIIIAILAVTILTMGNNINILHDTGNIKISSEDSSMSGKLTITEFKNIKKNENGTYNISQFYDRFGMPTGAKNDIVIKDGKAEYTLHNDTEFFIVDYYITDIKPKYNYGNDSAPKVTVEYLHNGKSVLSSSETAYADQCDVTFGVKIYSLDGTTLSSNSLNYDIPEFKKYLDKLYS